MSSRITLNQAVGPDAIKVKFYGKRKYQILFPEHVANKYFCPIFSLWRAYKTDSNNDTDDSEQDYAWEDLLILLLPSLYLRIKLNKIIVFRPRCGCFMWWERCSDGWAAARLAWQVAGSKYMLSVQKFAASSLWCWAHISNLKAATVNILTPAEIRADRADCRQPGADNSDPVRKLAWRRKLESNGKIHPIIRTGADMTTGWKHSRLDV